jgi:SpoIIAA-like
MIEPIDGLPPGTVGLRVSGEVHPQDYHDVVVPAIERAFAARDKVDVLVVLEEGFHYDRGAVWEDVKASLRRPLSWRRVAAVTSARWVATMLPLASFVLPGTFRAFAPGKLDAARAWVVGSVGADG